jgi:16S rRNA (cytidine1402-2'-O)-methyltransferase
MTDHPPLGRLYLVPNTLDFGVNTGAAPADLQTVLPLHVLQIAAKLTHWVAENAKTTRAFLKRVDAVVPLSQALQTLNIVELPRPQKGTKATVTSPLDALLAPALHGSDIGLISEAGLPAVADPGALLVEAAHRLGVTVMPLSGPSSLLMALSASGLNGQSFAFVGYLPVDAGQRNLKLRDLEAMSRRHQQTQLMIETPYRNQALLAAMLTSLSPNCRLSVSCGLTLQGGWTRSDSVAAWKQRTVALPNDVPAVFALLGV